MDCEPIDQPQASGAPQPDVTPHELEKIEEAKLKAKYPAMPGGAARVGGHSAFLQKRLAKGSM